MNLPPPRVTVIEGRKVLVVERRPPLPARLDELLVSPGMRRFPVRVSGWRSACGAQDHRLVPLAEGTYRTPHGEVLSLRVQVCADCEAVCVRDVTVDSIADATGFAGARLARLPRLAPRRRDHVIGWYTGARRNQRVYHHMGSRL